MTIAGTPLAADLNHAVDLALDPWEGQRGDPIFLSGGTWFHGYGLLAWEAPARMPGETLLRLRSRLDRVVDVTPGSRIDP